MLPYAQLQGGYKVLRSLSDAAWLDTDANLVDVEITLDHLKDVENLMDTVGSLPGHLQMAVESLIAAGSPPGESNAVNFKI